MDLDTLLRYITKASRDMWDLGWAEANAGNLSLRLNTEQFDAVGCFRPRTEFLPLAAAVPGLAGERFLVTGRGRFLRNVELAPARHVGFIELDGHGKAYRILWGFEPAGEPTSELPAHLLSHQSIKEALGDDGRAVIHTHAPNLIALTYVMPDLDTKRLTQALWQMHSECVVIFPQGIAFLPWMMPASAELGEATATALHDHPLAVWEHHGVCGTGRNLDEALGRIYVVEKAAGILLKVLAAGGIRKSLSPDQIRSMAAHFGCALDESLLI